MSNPEKQILATLVYYDVLKHPLTGWEVFRYLQTKGGQAGRTVSLAEVLEALGDGRNRLNDFIGRIDGFYCLRGREHLVAGRIKREKNNKKKWEKAELTAKFLRYAPFVRMVAVSGSLAAGNADAKSDIDLFIVIKKGRIWTGRFFITAIVQLLGKRRHGSLIRDRICLNHFITDDNLKLECRSLYNAQTYAHMVPLSGLEVFREFRKANEWISDYLSFDFRYRAPNSHYAEPDGLVVFFSKIFEFCYDKICGGVLEKIFCRWQKRHIEKSPLTYRKGGRVKFDDNQLEFHPDSPEKRILELYNKKMRELGLKELGNEKDSGLRK